MTDADQSTGGSKDPLHGMTLQAILTSLVETYGWPGLASRIKINCFASDPSINSSLKFLRKTPWARQKVEELYVRTQWARGKKNPAPASGAVSPAGGED